MTRHRQRSRSVLAHAAVLPALAVAALAFVAFANSPAPVTVHDDKFFVPARHALTWTDVAQIFSEDTWASTGSPAGTYRPLAILSLAVDGAIHGRDPTGYHWTNVALHTLASVLVFLLLLELLRFAPADRRREQDGLGWVAALAAAIFAVHPIHTEAVDSVFNRSEILATTGVVAALWCIARWHASRPAVAWTAATVLYLAALLCRESAVTLPVLAAAMLWLLHPQEPWRTRAQRVLPVGFLAIALAEYFVLRQHALASQMQGTAPALGTSAGDDLASRVLYSVATLREYARMLVWPHPLRVSYEDFTGGGLAAVFALHAALLGGAAWALRRAPLAAFAVVWFYVSLLPSTRVFTALGESLRLGGEALVELKNSLLLGERVVYLPSVALSIGLAAALAHLAKKRGLAAAAAVVAVPVVAGVVLTLQRNEQWKDPVRLFGAEVEAAPGNGDGWRLYVSALSSAERFEDAARACDSQLDQGGRSAQLFNNCGVVYDRLGRADRAIRAYQAAIAQGLATVGHANLGRVYARLGRTVEAEAEFAAAAEAEVDPARRHYRNGQRLARFHPDRTTEARREFEAALALQPDFAAARDALSRLGR